jgi:hypothetical protein
MKIFFVRKNSTLITECKQIKKFVNIFFQKMTFFLQMRLSQKIGFADALRFFSNTFFHFKFFVRYKLKTFVSYARSKSVCADEHWRSRKNLSFRTARHLFCERRWKTSHG